MPIEVEIPGGAIVEFPDGTPANQIQSVLTQQLNPTLAREREAEATVRREGSPGGTFQRFSDLVMDPFGISDEMRGAGQYLSELTTGRRARETGKSRWDTAGEAYTGEAERARAERRVARQDWGVVPELLGGIATMGPARTAIVAAPSWLARARQSAKLGAGYGAAAGFGHSEGGIPERITGTLEGAAIGGVAAPLIADVAIPGAVQLYRGGRAGTEYARRALASVRDPQQHALETVADRALASGLDFGALRGRMAPPISADLRNRGFTDEHLLDIISRQMQGETAANVAADYAHMVNAKGEKFTGQTARRYFREYERTNPTPMNIIDIAKEVSGEGRSRPITRLGRAAYGLAGDESEIAAQAAQALEGRQLTQPGRMAGIVREAVGGGDFEATQLAAQRRLETESGRAYEQFYAEPHLAIDRLADLMDDPLFRRANLQAQRQARVETIRRNQEAARRGLPPEPVPTVGAENEVFSPQMLDLIQRQLRITGEGFANNPNAARHAQNLREVFLDRIEEFYPTFRGIRQNYASGMMEQEALQEGRNLVLQLGQRASDALRKFNDLTPAQQDLFRIGFARHLLDLVAKPREGAAVANQFRTGAVQEIIGRLFPPAKTTIAGLTKGTPKYAEAAAQRAHETEVHAAGQTLLTQLRREAITTRTTSDVLAGSRTAEYAGDMARLSEGARTAADVLSGRFWKVLENFSNKLTTHLGQRGSAEVLRVLTETDPANMLQILNRLANVAQTQAQRQAYLTTARQIRNLNVGRLGLPGRTGLAFGGMGAQQPERAPVEIRR